MLFLAGRSSFICAQRIDNTITKYKHSADTEFTNQDDCFYSKEILNSSLQNVGVLPLRTKGLRRSAKIKAAKRKLDLMLNRQEEVVKQALNIKNALNTNFKRHISKTNWNF